VAALLDGRLDGRIVCAARAGRQMASQRNIGAYNHGNAPPTADAEHMPMPRPVAAKGRAGRARLAGAALYVSAHTW